MNSESSKKITYNEIQVAHTLSICDLTSIVGGLDTDPILHSGKRNGFSIGASSKQNSLKVDRGTITLPGLEW